MAARAGHASIVRLLLERQVNANARTIDGRTPDWVALEEKQQAAADILAARGADKSGPRPPTLSGPYLGQKPPGRTPAPFVPALPGIDEGRHGIFSFTPTAPPSTGSPHGAR